MLGADPGRGQHWRERHPSLGDHVEISLRCEIGVVDQIDAGLSSGAGRSRTARMDRDFDVVSMSLIDNGSDLVIGDGLHVAPGRVGDLDQIDTSLALSAGLANELVARIAQHARRVSRSAFKGWIRVGIKNAAVIAEGPARDNHARALEQPALDRLAHCHIGKPFATRHGDAGHPGTQHSADRMRCPEAAKLSRRRVPHARQCALVKRDVAMRVDEAGQDELARGIDDPVVRGLRPHHPLRSADKRDSVSLDDKEAVRDGVAP